ncbi:O-antigen ligase family protein [uncultured Pseudomonas sp.]|uniref:O-antigen ligase family protein n=1 Tax=uncultured Pseudomonas sp. TaxID=114707 RepID=UPI00258CDFA3|nr:O-antigen ligase family protein [uncultured Pseudomonas sp.]
MIQARCRNFGYVALAIGLFVLMAGKIVIESGSARNTQVYLWLLFPSLCVVLYRIFVLRKLNISLWCWPWLLYLAWAALSTSWATASDVDAWSIAKRSLFICLFIVAIFQLMTKPIHFKRILILSLLVIALGALASLLYQYLILDRPLVYRAYRIDRLGFGDFANFRWPVAAGIFYGSIAVWALGFALNKKTGRYMAILCFSCFIIMSLYVLLTYSRGAWFGLMIAALLSTLLCKSGRARWFLMLGTFCVLVLVVLFWSQIINEVETNRLSGRGAIWRYFFEVMSGHWLLGFGLGTPFEFIWSDGVTVSPHAHSLYLQQVYDSGLISLSLLLLAIGAVLWRSWGARDEYWIQIAVPVLIFALIAMLTDVERILVRPGDMWVVFWLPVAVVLATISRDRKANRDSDCF